MDGSLIERERFATAAALLPDVLRRRAVAAGAVTAPAHALDGAAPRPRTVGVGPFGGLRGTVVTDGGLPFTVGIYRREIGSCSVARLQSRNRFFFQRTWSNVREDRADVAVLCFVRSGCLRMTQAGGDSVIEAGDLLIAQSTAPFRIESVSAVCDLLQLTVPVHKLRTVFCADVASGLCASAASRPLRLAEHILADLLDGAGEISVHASAQLVDVVLAVLGDTLKARHVNSCASRSLANRRIGDVLRYVDQHLSDPDLSAAGVARACGISPRYLSALLRRNRTPFAALVWNKRLEAARQWLATSRPSEVSVSEIAFRTGFKSHAHFSRMFKRRFQVSPTQYRALAA